MKRRPEDEEIIYFKEFPISDRTRIAACKWTLEKVWIQVRKIIEDETVILLGVK